jgi:hypothetical protein
VTATSGSYNLRSHLNFALDPNEQMDRFDLILRSSDELARATVDLYEIWSGEVVIPNVRVKQ